MYPYTVYINYGHSNAYRPVVVKSYQQGISESAFRRLNLVVPSKLYRGEVGPSAYNYTYGLKYDFDWEDEMKMAKELGRKSSLKKVGTPIDLYDFYDEIGYEKKTKKFNGLSLKQHILTNLGQ